jgi:DNA-cytosine methyltransferase
MNVLSLFDGMSGGQQALERCGIKVDNYYASEIDKYAIKVTMANYPNTIQLGDVVGIDGYKLPKIDLLCAGSPCQSFSFAGKRKGMATKCEIEILTLEHYLELKSEGYEFEGQSYLFWEFMRLLNEVKPKYFLLENVEMGEKWEKVLSKAVGVNGIHINSALVSAQNRRRIYWTNIGLEPAGLFGDLESTIKQPKDKGVLLRDILETEVDEKYFLNENSINRITVKVPDSEDYFENDYIKIGKQGNIKKDQNKASCFTAGGNSAGDHSDMDLIVTDTIKHHQQDELNYIDGKARCLVVGSHGNSKHFTKTVIPIGLTEVRTTEAKKIRKETGSNPKRAKELAERTDGKTGALLTSATPDNLIKTTEHFIRDDEWQEGEGQVLTDRQKANYKSEDEKANSFLSTSWKGSQANGMTLVGNSRVRRLTPTECERLQTVKDGFTAHVSDSQRYKIIGNGWTVDVVAHILSYINKK